jgi:hypothetical protein
MTATVGTPGDGLCQVCGHAVPPGWLLCRPHWSRVPRRLQNEVYAALRAYKASTGTLGELRAVQERAVEACAQAIHG